MLFLPNQFISTRHPQIPVSGIPNCNFAILATYFSACRKRLSRAPPIGLVATDTTIDWNPKKAKLGLEHRHRTM